MLLCYYDMKRYWKYDNIWTLEYDTNDLYIAFTPRHLPPSSGWQTVDDAEYPSPSVVLHRLNQMVTIKNYFSSKKKGDGDHEEEENDMTTSPLEFMDFDFEIPEHFEIPKVSVCYRRPHQRFRCKTWHGLKLPENVHTLEMFHVQP